MSTKSFYRGAVWLPLVVPACIAFWVHVLEWRPTVNPVDAFVQILLMSGIYGGLPYFVLAAYASWWIRDQPEAVIFRKALQAPLWMIAAWLPLVAFVGVRSGRLDLFAGLTGLGVLFIVLLGYAYVALVVVLRVFMSRLGWLPAWKHESIRRLSRG